MTNINQPSTADGLGVIAAALLICIFAFLWMVLMAPVQYAKMAAFAATRLVRR